MRLEDIGFYTLSDQRAQNASATSPLSRCEMILTDRCNFHCPYCRGVQERLRGDIPISEAERILDLWIDEGLRNVRFSGGEPMLYDGLPRLVKRCEAAGVQRIAVSTNGSATKKAYKYLIYCGVNDFSVSLDGGCCATGEAMTGGVAGSWEHTTEIIRFLSKRVYTTVGMVFTEQNVRQCVEAVKFAASLGVADIRVIPAAQVSLALEALGDLPDDFLAQYPILRYRVNRARAGKPFRGIHVDDPRRCRLVLDDMAVAGVWHFPCIIYMREGGDPIGYMGEDVRRDRAIWSRLHDVYSDPICRDNCLDVCVAYNKKADQDRLKGEL